MPTTRTETVTAHDGGRFDALTVVPDSGEGPGILLLHEIFGVSRYVADVAERLADAGYSAVVPDLFWRIEPGISLEHSEETLPVALGYGARFDVEQGLRDCDAALTHLRSLPETGGRAGVVGFCLGGTLAYHVAALSGPDTCVSYYGSGVPAATDLAAAIACPVLLHFGGADPYIPREQVDQAEAALAPHENVEFVVQEGAGHAFDNPAPMFHNPEAAAAAWRVTQDFLSRTLPRG